MLDIKIHIKKVSALVSAVSELLAIREPLITRRDFKPSHFENADGNVLKLLADSKGLHPGSARFSRTENLLTVEIIDNSKNLVIHSSVLDGGTHHTEEQARELLSEYGNLSWSTASFEAISEHLWRLIRKCLNGHEGMWESRALMMAKRVLRILTELRDAGHEELSEASFRTHLPLERLIALSVDERVSLIARKQLTEYLIDLPEYETEKALSGDLNETCSVQHGYLMSIVSTALRQLLPPQVIRYEYLIKAPFKKVEAEITPLGALVTIHYHTTEERFSLFPRPIRVD